MYERDKLEEYIGSSKMKIVNADFRVRLSKELEEKYENGAYAKAINNLNGYIEQIKSLNFKYPGNARPIFYVYLVPDEDFIQLLKFPNKTKKGGGRPVPSYDLEGFNMAYGISQNLCVSDKEPTISNVVNNIHEFAHLVCSQFFYSNRFINEGFAEALPLYAMDFEKDFDEHREALKKLKKSQLFSVKELIEMERNNTFGNGVLIPNKSCSFDLSYISSYLFVRGCLETIAFKYNIDRISTLQKFLEIVRNAQFRNEWLVCNIADTLGLSREELLNKKTFQLDVLKKL